MPGSATRGVTRAHGIRGVAVCSLLALPLSCASPPAFSPDSLEAGMSSDVVRENFGEPESIEPGSAEDASCWTYREKPRSLESSVLLLDFEDRALVGWEAHEPVDLGWRCTPDPFCPPGSAADPTTHCQSLSNCGNPKVYFWAPATCGSVRALTGRPGGLAVGNTAYIGTDRASLWSEPSWSTARRARLEGGREVRILERRIVGPRVTWWCRVAEDGGADGWILCASLERQKPR
jgi:hypothetical protein